MESNPLLQKVLNKDVKEHISSAMIKKGKSKDGNDYYYVEFTFDSVWSDRLFLNKDKLFILATVCSQDVLDEFAEDFLKQD